ncbi:SDR family oxidoreductase [Weissella viridescens]|uniref:SDR family oxidoreductase n=1 Tax=Weissella viridescens TaxID=1629 RepID=A0A3P2REP6_WEIVI|nr:SDR family oxidoreductase [Weissella viridescens]RRG17661.1 SDR family oxidoreductase [Weissella viridescens]
MDLHLKHKTALVTGSTKGIGHAIAESLAQEGVNVIINGRRVETVTQVQSDLQARYPEVTVDAAPFDLSQETERAELYERFPDIDILVNNMAIFEEATFAGLTLEDWRHYFEVNAVSGIALAKFYLPRLLEKDANGRIIFIASEAAVMPSPEMPHYSMTKAMNLSLAKSLSMQTAGTTVTVNTVMPGSTLTEGVRSLLTSLYPDVTSLAEQERLFMLNNRPTSTIQRLIKPQEIGDFVTYVASPKAGAFSGEALRMDGGIVPTMN